MKVSIIRKVLARQEKVDRMTHRYLARPFNGRERRRIYVARCAAEYISLNGASGDKVTIQITNRSNPNGITLTYFRATKDHKAERFVNRFWMESRVPLERAVA